MNKSFLLAFILSVFTLWYWILTGEWWNQIADVNSSEFANFQSCAISIVGAWALIGIFWEGRNYA